MSARNNDLFAPCSIREGEIVAWETYHEHSADFGSADSATPVLHGHFLIKKTRMNDRPIECEKNRWCLFILQRSIALQIAIRLLLLLLLIGRSLGDQAKAMEQEPDWEMRCEPPKR